MKLLLVIYIWGFKVRQYVDVLKEYLYLFKVQVAFSDSGSFKKVEQKTPSLKR